MNDIIMTLLKASEVGAITAFKNIGNNDKNKVDDDTVKAINYIFNKNSLPGEIIIGEGELDNAPLLYPGQTFADKILYDIAIDPVEGTIPVAYNNPGAITSIAIAKKGFIAKIPEMYMEKLFVSQELKKHIDLKKGIEWNLDNLKKEINYKELKAIVLNKERHIKIINKMKKMGIHVSLINDGDVMGAIDVVNGDADFVYGIGGSPEGALMASLAIASNCKMEWRLMRINKIITSKTNDKNRYKKELKEITKSCFDFDKVYSCYDLVGDKKTTFVSSAITSGNTLKGVKYINNTYEVSSIVAEKGIVRNIIGTYNLEKLLKYEKDLSFLKWNE